MKLRLSIFFIVISLTLIGCNLRSNSEQMAQQGTNFEENQDCNAQNEYIFMPIVSFQETGGFYLGSNMYGNYLYYYDKVTGISGVLCADPSCEHNNSSCGAYMQQGATMSVYDGNLYWIASEADSPNQFLWRSDLSGMNREKLKLLSFQDIVIKYQPQRYVIHQGTLYILGDANTVVGTQTGNWLTIVATSLDDSQEFTVLHEASIDQGVQRTVRFIGDHAYISLITFDQGIGIYDMSVQKLDLTTGESETIYSEVGLTVIPGDLWVTEQGNLYLPGADDEFAYIWKIEEGKRVEIKRWQTVDPSVPDVMDGIALHLTWSEGIRGAEIIDLKGETVYSGLLFPEDVPGLPGDPNSYSFAIVGGDQNKLILNLQDLADMHYPKDYTIMLDINNNMKATVLWSNQK